MKEKELEEEIKELKKTVEKLSQALAEIKEKDQRGEEPTGVRKQILDIIKKEKEPRTVKEVADRIGRAETTVSGYLLDLYESGYLERESQLVDVSPTRRVRQLRYYVPEEKRRKWHYL